MLAGVLEPGSDLRTLAECEALLAKIPNAQSILAKANDAVDFAAAALNRVPPNLSRAAKAAVQLQSEVTGWVQDLSTLLADSAGTASGALGIALETTLLERIHDSLVRHVAAGYGEEDWRLHEGMLRLTQQCAQDEGGSRHAGSGRSMNAILALTGAEEPLRQEGPRPEFTFKEEQYPEQVDWLGQKKQIDAAKKAGVRKVVLVSSMGVTQPDNFLNTIGDGKILLWKRKAEEYLIASGLNYTILHPGGLIDDQGGQREIVLGVDDELLKLAVRRIPRADVAELCVQAIVLPEADNRAVDCVAKDPGDGTPTTDFADLFRNLKANCKYAPLPAGVAV